MTNTAWLRRTHRRKLELLEFGMRAVCWETWRTGVDREYSSFTDCGRDRRGEHIFDCVEQYPEYLL